MIDTKSYVRNDFTDQFLPRPYNIAIEIKDIQAIHLHLNEFKNVKELTPT